MTRDDLIKELNNFSYHNSKKCSLPKDRVSLCAECLADFILEDRKRIIKPLIDFREDYVTGGEPWSITGAHEAIDETLKLAGVDQ